MEIYGTVDNGKFKPCNIEVFKKAFIYFEGKNIKITIEKVNRTRSLNQNDYYWGVIVAMITNEFRELGNELDSQETHEFLRYKFLKVQKELINNETGEIETINLIRSTTKISTIEFEEYCESCRRFAVETLTLNIPDPTR